MECLLLAQSGRLATEFQCLRSGVKRTSRGHALMSAFDPKRAFGFEFLNRQADLEYLDRVEVEFRVQAALDGGGLAEAVLLTRKQQIPNWFALAA